MDSQGTVLPEDAVFQGTVSDECTQIASYEANRFVYNNAIPQDLVHSTSGI